MLGSLLTLTNNAGLVFGLVVATYFEYFTQLKIQVLLPIAFFVAFSYFPESPEEKTNVSEDLAFISVYWIYFRFQSVTFFQGIKNDQLEQEKQPMKTAEKAIMEDSSDSEKLSLSDFCKFVLFRFI